MKFLDKPLNVIISAGASGIGRSIAEAFIEQGSRVFICDISDHYIKKFNQEYPDVIVKRTDVSKYKQVLSFFKFISNKINHVDVIINCAGIAGPTSSLEKIDPKDWKHTIDINLNGMFYILREGIPLLKKSKTPSIINIASTASFFGFPLRSPYTAAKWAVIGLTKTLAMELGGMDVRVNAICPGSVSGERIDRVLKADAKAQGKSISEIRQLYTKQVSMKTFVESEDVAHLVLFLVSKYGRFISGQAIGLDGHTEGLSTEL
tara:strand:+ start:326 stop:1111 length:786 start_codon:yes stop_codon:yes gene_type:complete